MEIPAGAVPERTVKPLTDAQRAALRKREGGFASTDKLLSLETHKAERVRTSKSKHPTSSQWTKDEDPEPES